MMEPDGVAQPAQRERRAADSAVCTGGRDRPASHRDQYAPDIRAAPSSGMRRGGQVLGAAAQFEHHRAAGAAAPRRARLHAAVGR